MPRAEIWSSHCSGIDGDHSGPAFGSGSFLGCTEGGGLRDGPRDSNPLMPPPLRPDLRRQPAAPRRGAAARWRPPNEEASRSAAPGRRLLAAPRRPASPGSDGGHGRAGPRDGAPANERAAGGPDFRPCGRH